MKLINPSEISGKIMTLIDDAEKELIIVSPYNKIIGWDKLIRKIRKAQSKGIPISWYCRGNNLAEENSEEVLSLGIIPILVKNLHAKIYMNEQKAIFTSMNLSKISDDQSIDLGYITETKEEYDEIYNVFKKHIHCSISKDTITETIINTRVHTVNERKNPKPFFTKYYYIDRIHNHLCSKYKFESFKYNGIDFLEYLNFIKPGFNVQFETYGNAIKIYICPPSTILVENIKAAVNEDLKNNKLYFKNKLAFSEFNRNIYYYYTSNHKVINWEKNSADVFLNDLDLVFKLIYRNV